MAETPDQYSLAEWLERRATTWEPPGYHPEFDEPLFVLPGETAPVRLSEICPAE